MLKYSLIFFSLIICQFAYMQVMPEIKVKPTKQNGKLKVYYRLKSESFLPNSKIFDWKNSLEKLEANERFNPQKRYFVETCKLSQGKKNGEFLISEILLKEIKTTNGTDYTLKVGGGYVQGNYLNDQFQGKIQFINGVQINSNVIEINYDKNNITDQIVELECFFDFKPIKVSYSFKQGVVNEINSKEFFYQKIDNSLCLNRKYCGSKFWIEYFTSNVPDYCSSKFTEQFVEDKTIDVYEEEWDSKIIFDSKHLVAKIQISKDGIRNGKSEFYDYRNGNLREVANFKNGLLDGKCIKYFENGQIEIESVFSEGFIKLLKYYSDGVNFNSPELNFEGLSKVQTNSISSITFSRADASIISFKDFSAFYYFPVFIGKKDYSTDIKLIKSKGGKIIEATEYQLLFELNFLTESNACYIKDDFSIMYNGKPMITYLLDNQKHVIKDVLWKDEMGKIVYTLSKKVEEENIKLKESKKVEAAINNTIINCSYCSKKFRYGDAIISGDDCNCFDYKNGEKKKIHVGIAIKDLYFCSRKCDLDHEKDCCRRNGYSFEK
jgi:antitoxin component YwqK of YwqJK toxin-antitoxin module